MKKVLIVEDQFVEANDIQLMLQRAGYEVCGIARSVEIAQEIIKKENPALVLLDIFLKGDLTGIDLARQLKEAGIAFIYLSANSNEDVLGQAKTTEPYGFLVKPFREKDLLVTLEIAQYRHEHSRESRYRRENQLLQQLEAIEKNTMEWKDKLLQMARVIQQEIPFDYLAIGFNDTTQTNRLVSFLRIGFDEYQTIGLKELATMTGVHIDEINKSLNAGVEDKTAALYNNGEFENRAQRYSLNNLSYERFQQRALLSFPPLRFYSRRPGTYNTDHIALLHRLQPILSKIIDQTDADKNIDEHKKTIAMTNENMQPTYRGFDGIIGQSHLLLNVFDQIMQVAPFDTSVLILGESGTGKERIADCIHQFSTRKKKALVKINCAALPPTLI